MILRDTLFSLVFAPSMAIAIWEWVLYYRAASKVRAQAQAEGSDWPFASDPRYMVRFVFMPQELIEPNDSPAMQKAKAQLLALRKRLWRRVALAVGLVFLGFCAAVTYSIAVPLLSGSE